MIAVVAGFCFAPIHSVHVVRRAAPGLGESFTASIAELKTDSSVRAVIVTGAGRAFSAGGDMGFLKSRTEDNALHNAEVMRQFYSRFLVLRSLEVPTIAAINGPAIGAGLCVACACDMRLAAADAKMGWTFVGLGLHPGMAATHFTSQIIGPQLAAKWLLTGGVFDGRAAAEMGLVLEAVEGDGVLDEAVALAGQIAAQGPVAVSTLTRSLRLKQDAGLDLALAREADAQAHCYASADMVEGIDAVLAKRRPQF